MTSHRNCVCRYYYSLHNRLIMYVLSSSGTGWHPVVDLKHLSSMKALASSRWISPMCLQKSHSVSSFHLFSHTTIQCLLITLHITSHFNIKLTTFSFNFVVTRRSPLSGTSVEQWILLSYGHSVLHLAWSPLTDLGGGTAGECPLLWVRILQILIQMFFSKVTPSATGHHPVD